ncbi:MAG: hypothetical protein U0168_22670 [Nannocystaceae bacterium]
MPLSPGGLWLAEMTTPAPQPPRRTQKDSCGVGRGASSSTTSSSHAASCCATAWANARLCVRVS